MWKMVYEVTNEGDAYLIMSTSKSFCGGRRNFFLFSTSYTAPDNATVTLQQQHHHTLSLNNSTTQIWQFTFSFTLTCSTTNNRKKLKLIDWQLEYMTRKAYILHWLEGSTVTSVIDTRQQFQVNDILRRLHIIHLNIHHHSSPTHHQQYTHNISTCWIYQ